MKKRILSILIAIVVLVIAATPVMASVPVNTSATVTGFGTFANQPLISGITNGSSSLQKISFNLWAKVPLELSPPAINSVSSVSGRISLLDLRNKKVITGCITGMGGPNFVFGDLILSGYCSINGRGCFEFELGIGDEGKGLCAIVRDYISFEIPSCGYYVSGTLCAGDICIPVSLNNPR